MLLGGGSNTTDTADQDISFMNFAGGFFGTTAFLVDGSWDTDTEWGAVIFVPGVDAVQEFKIQNNSFTAQYGWSTGNVVNVVTKSGTHDFHGSAYEFYSSNNFNALNYFQSPGSCQGSSTPTSAPSAATRLAERPAARCTFPACINSGTRPSSSVTTSTSMQTPHPRRPTRCQTPTSWPATSPSSSAATTSRAGVDALGRPIYNGQIYDPRSGHAITAGQPDTYNPVTNPYGTNLVANAQPDYIRNPVPGNILSNIAGYTPDAVGAKLLSYFPAAQKSGNVANNLILAGAGAHVLGRVRHQGRPEHQRQYQRLFPLLLQGRGKDRRRQTTGDPIRQAKAISGPTTAGACGRGSRDDFQPHLHHEHHFGRPALA
jgi:hypothetical protein